MRIIKIKLYLLTSLITEEYTFSIILRNLPLVTNLPVLRTVWEYVGIPNITDHTCPFHFKNVQKFQSFKVSKMANRRNMGLNSKVITEYKTQPCKKSHHDWMFYTFKQIRQQIPGDRHLKNRLKQHFHSKQNDVARWLIRQFSEVFHHSFHSNNLTTYTIKNMF